LSGDALSLSPSTRESNRLSVGVVKAVSAAERTDLGLRTRLKKLQDGRFDESSQPQSLPKRKRAVSRRKTHSKRRAHPSQLRDDTGDVALNTINVMDRSEPESTIEVLQTHGYSALVSPAEIASTGSMVTVGDFADTTSQCARHSSNDVETSSPVDATKRKLRTLLADLLSRHQLDYKSVLDEVIPAAQELYEQSVHRQPHNDWYIDFENLSRALDHWRNLVFELAKATSTERLSSEDLSLRFASQTTFEGRMLVFRECRSRLQPNFTYNTWIVMLAVLFEGLLADVGMPLPFEAMVERLGVVNQTLISSFVAMGDENWGGGGQTRTAARNPAQDHTKI
jgi:hypothetical protein